MTGNVGHRQGHRDRGRASGQADTHRGRALEHGRAAIERGRVSGQVNGRGIGAWRLSRIGAKDTGCETRDTGCRIWHDGQGTRLSQSATENSSCSPALCCHLLSKAGVIGFRQADGGCRKLDASHETRYMECETWDAGQGSVTLNYCSFDDKRRQAFRLLLMAEGLRPTVVDSGSQCWQ